MTKSDIVGRGVKAQAVVDKNLAVAYRGAQQYAKVIEDAVKNGMFDSGLEAKRHLAKARTLAGKIAEAAELAAELHRDGTDLAVANDVDLGSITTVGGVPFVKRDAGMSTMSGGGR